MSLDTYELSESNPCTPDFEFEGNCDVLITGNVACCVLRQVGNSGFYPLTDSEGNEIFYMATNTTAVVFNGTLLNKSKHAKFAISLDKSELGPESQARVTISKGW